MFNMVVFGPPGCGKGTQSRNIVDKFGLIHLSTGDILRHEIEIDSAIGELIKKFVDRGYLVPDDIVLRELFRTALKHQDSAGLIFDGFPRNVAQAKVLDRFLNMRDFPINLVLSLEVEENELVKRIMHRSRNSGRSDDTEEIIRNRFLVYEQETFPLKEYYRKQGKLVSVSGMAPIKVVFGRIRNVIENRMNGLETKGIAK